MSISIRHQEPVDIESIARLFSDPSVIDGTMRLPLASAAAVGDRLPPNPSAVRLVAVDDDLPVGHVDSVLGFAELLTHPHIARHRHAADLELLAVRESARGRGIGRRLLDSVVDLADNWLQITRLSLVVWADNLAAISLYGSSGFVIEGTMPSYVHRKGMFVDAHLMGRVDDADR